MTQIGHRAVAAETYYAFQTNERGHNDAAVFFSDYFFEIGVIATRSVNFKSNKNKMLNVIEIKIFSADELGEQTNWVETFV